MLNMYVNTSDNRYLNKSLTVIAENVPCDFKADTSASEPVIILSPDAYDASCNYVYLSDTGRYYFVVDRRFSQQSIELVLSVDVRSSFDFSNCDCIALRSSSDYNMYLDDNQYTRLQYSEVYTKPFPNQFSKSLNYILMIAG